MSQLQTVNKEQAVLEKEELSTEENERGAALLDLKNELDKEMNENNISKPNRHARRAREAAYKKFLKKLQKKQIDKAIKAKVK